MEPHLSHRLSCAALPNSRAGYTLERGQIKGGSLPSQQRGAGTMAIPTEPIGSIPRPLPLIEAARAYRAGHVSEAELRLVYDAAVRETIEQFENTGSPIITDGEQAKDSFATYPIRGLDNLSADGMSIAFADGHIRSLPRLTGGPFSYRTPADVYLERAQQYAHVPV